MDSITLDSGEATGCSKVIKAVYYVEEMIVVGGEGGGCLPMLYKVIASGATTTRGGGGCSGVTPTDWQVSGLHIHVPFWYFITRHG